ncbi:MAG: sigma factor-like helix-turn-helix DNA-binding protein [Bacteroidota bacterium]
MNAGQTRTQFIEEVFEESLFKFYDLLHAGTFNSYNDLEAMIVTICSYKLKEGFVRLKKERRLYCVEADQLNYLREAQYANELASQQKQEELLMLVHQKMLLLPYEDREILNSFFEGQELNDIAKSLSISSAACRKRKQRALDKLRSLVFQSHKALKYDQPIPERATKRNETVFAQSAFR